MRDLLIGALSALALVSSAQAHDADRPDLDNWYANLHRQGMAHCCSKEDCHKTDAELRNGQWYARLGERIFDSKGHEQWILGPYKPIPDGIIVRDEKGNAIPNPEGEAVICHQKLTRDRAGNMFWEAATIYCFVPGPQG